MKRAFILFAAFAWFTAAAQAQHSHHATQHKVARAAKLAVTDDAAARRLTVRLGPLKLPANSGHLAVAQPPEFFLEMPFDGWITAYHPRLVDAGGAAIPGRMLHHVAFWNTGRSDFLCPNKQEHIFGAGGELNDWPALPGMGYAVSQGEKVRINTMFHNPTDTSYPEAYLVVEMEYHTRGEGPDRKNALKSVYPVWFDVKECGSSSYDLPAGGSEKSGRFRLGYPGVLLGVGGHMHDFGQAVRLQDVGRNRPVADLKAELDEQGRIRSMPIANFAASGGYRMERGDRFEVTASYQNPGAEQPAGAMGIAVGYFLPDDDGEMAALRRPAEPDASQKKKPAKKKKQASLDEAAEQARRSLEITEDIEPPVPLDQPRPEYSAEAREHKHEGVVVLRVEVGADGRVSHVSVQNPLGMGLDEKAQEAVRQWVYKPALKDGRPVAVQFDLSINFRLDP